MSSSAQLSFGPSRYVEMGLSDQSRVMGLDPILRWPNTFAHVDWWSLQREAE